VKLERPETVSEKHPAADGRGDAKPKSQMRESAMTEEKGRYRPTDRERASMQAFLDNFTNRHAPGVNVNRSNGRVGIEFQHPEQLVGKILLMDAIGTKDLDFLYGVLRGLLNAGDEKGETLNFMLAIIKGVEPKDQTEALIASQMAAVHLAMMSYAGRLAQADTIQQQESAERAFNRLARTFAVQVEALKRYRTNGEQRIVVQHVTVNSGGQAIVANVPDGAASERSAGTPLLTQGTEEKLPSLAGTRGGGRKEKVWATS
jgi:hypothetical protein